VYKVTMEVLAIVASKHLREVSADKPRGNMKLFRLNVRDCRMSLAVIQLSRQVNLSKAWQANNPWLCKSSKLLSTKFSRVREVTQLQPS